MSDWNSELYMKFERERTRAASDLVDTAVAAGSFKTLVAAVQAAGLVETLKSGTYTVFAPVRALRALRAPLISSPPLGAHSRAPPAAARRPTTRSPSCPRAPWRAC